MSSRVLCLMYGLASIYLKARSFLNIDHSISNVLIQVHLRLYFKWVRVHFRIKQILLTIKRIHFKFCLCDTDESGDSLSKTFS